MFCSQCGTKATGKFCHSCGCPLHAPDTGVAQSEVSVSQEPVDWDSDARYETIVRVESVRTVIARHAATAPKGLSGEALLALYDKIVPSPVPLESLVSVVQPLYESWGIRTGKNRSEVIDAPIGRSIARTLCSFAKHSQTFQSAEQREDGCTLMADLPSSALALKGRLTISLDRDGYRTRVAATTYIPGQMYDWGKSTRCLEQLFLDIRSDQGLPPASVHRRVA